MSERPQVLVSACLLGERVRYHGGDAWIAHPILERWHAEGRLVAFCPEVAGGLTTGGIITNRAETFSLVDGTVTATPIVLKNPTRLPNGSFQFSFTNLPGATFTALASTNVAPSPSNWTVLGGVAQISPGQFQFIDAQATNNPRRFYGARSP